MLKHDSAAPARQAVPPPSSLHRSRPRNGHLHEPRFLQALTLRERMDLLRAAGHPPAGSEANYELGFQRLGLWKEQKVFARQALFEERLGAEGISEQDLLDLLASGTASFAPLVDTQGLPPWLVQLGRLRRSRPGEAPLPPLLEQEFPFAVFHPFVAPLVHDATRRLSRRWSSLLRRSPSSPVRMERVLPRLVLSLQLRLCYQASRALVLELHLARVAGALSGSTSEERFQEFLAVLKTPRSRAALLRFYPVLARHLAEHAGLWVDSVEELLQRFLLDWEDLRALLRLSPDDEIAEIRIGEGDRHKGGRSVSIMRFTSGARVVYKPRSLAVEAHFQDLLRWLNARGAQPALKTLQVLERGTHGWMEFAETQPCSSRDELERFYLRQGAYLALLYALEATDFHAENLIAAGEHPVLVDLESLFHPRFDGGQDFEWEMLSRSVLRIGILPRRIGAHGDVDGIDLSGLGGQPGQLAPVGIATWEDAGTDQMRFVRQRRPLKGSQNRPTLDGRDVEVQEFTGCIEKGFEEMYRLLLRHRAELVDNRGPLHWFQNDEIRVLLRPTWVYAQLLEDSLHPDYLRDALDRDRFFDWLWGIDWEHREKGTIVNAERRDLLAGDIPYFSSFPASKDLYDSRGERLAELAQRSALAEVKEVLAALGESDLKRQLSAIRSSLETLPTIDELNDGRAQRPRSSGSGRQLDAEMLLQQARAIGDRLSDLAVERDGEANWLTLASRGTRHLVLEPLGIDLYGGLCGVALFLAHLAFACGDEKLERLARAAVRRVRQRIESNSEDLSIGAFTGLGGVIYTLTHLAALWNDRQTLALAEGCVERAALKIEADEALDLMSGAAGCIGAILPLYRQTGSPFILDVARTCGDRLLARAEPQPRGLGWHTSISPVALAGFAHGNAGFAWALSHLAEAAQDERYRHCASAALEYERFLFSAEHGNWQDVRPVPGDGGSAEERGRRFMVAWCHGAAGIGLARLATPREEWDERSAPDIEIALQTTVQRGFGGNHSLCHGDFGNLELLLNARQADGFGSWSVRCDELAGRVAGDLTASGCIGGIPGGAESPGLMLGLAGTGWGLLRLAVPGIIPSILTLEGPRHRDVG